MPSTRPILVLDDDPDLLDMLARLLEHEGYEVVTALNAERALVVCEEDQPSLVIADLMLPGMDGEAFLTELRARFGDAAPAVAILSASAAREEISGRLTVDASLAKPFDLDDIRDVAARFAERIPS